MNKNSSLLGCALGLMLFCTSCLGPNKTWNGLHDWNVKATNDKWGNEAVFVGFNIIPVYGVCYLADILVFNSIEFWKAGDKTPTK